MAEVSGNEYDSFYCRRELFRSETDCGYFNLGVNDPGNMYDYISYYQEIAESLQKKNCKAVL